jgi:Tfp pilus assembly protein PilF
LRFRWPAALATLVLSSTTVTQAAPFTPRDDQQVLLRLPSSANGPVQRERAERRRQLSREPRRADLAAEVVADLLAQLAADGDPRFAGYAQGALAPWWNDPAPPPDLRVARAVLRQFGHDFDAAQADLDAVVLQDPSHLQAWAWIAAIAMVQARYDRAQQACDRLAQHGSDLQAQACTATVDAATGQAGRAAITFERALAADPGGPRELHLWVLTRLAETRERLGDASSAERAYRAALALGLDDSYLLAAYADFLLDQQRPAEVLALLKDRERNDLHLLRLALAGKALQHGRAATWQAALTARFDAARQRGDTAHQKEEARFALAVLGDAARALPLAQANYAVQREAADARVLLEAALAARQKAAAAPALDWLRRSRFESAVLQTLAARIEALP